MTKTRGMSVIVVVVQAVVVMVMVVMAAARDDRCQQMRGECRLVTWVTDGAVTRNFSCLCKYGEDVSHDLAGLSKVTCMNTAAKDYINTTIVHNVGCKVQSQVFPVPLLAACRGSRHLVLHVVDSPWFSLPSPVPSSAFTSEVPRTVTATFINSNVSGMPEGVLSGVGVEAKVWVEGGHMGVIENQAFSGYPTDARVTLTFRNTTILSVIQKAFDLPPAAQVEFHGCRVLKFDRYSYSGGSELTLNGVMVANLLQSSINIYGLRKLNVTNCRVASVYDNALEYRYPTYIRNVTGGHRVLEGSEAIFADNRFLSGNGQAFTELCSVARLVWRNNTVLTSDDMPLRLQNPSCTTQRDWSHVFSLTGLRCQNCQDFSDPDNQTCAMYQTGYCVSCEAPMDGCYEPILPYLITKCRASHPHISRDLNSTCTAFATRRPRTAKALQGQKEAVAAAPFLTPRLLVVTAAVTLLLAVTQ